MSGSFVKIEKITVFDSRRGKGYLASGYIRGSYINLVVDSSWTLESGPRFPASVRSQYEGRP